MDSTLTIILINFQLNYTISEYGKYSNTMKSVFNDRTNSFH